MKIELITTEEYNALTDIYNNFPGLFLQNKGYECIDKDNLSDADKSAIKQVNEILKKSIFGFSYFQNFRKHKDGNPQIRFQYNYNYDGAGISFIGVGYILIEELLNGFKN